MDQAAADFSRAVKIKPEDQELWYKAAAARLGSGDLDAYRKIRAEALARFAGTQIPMAASDVLYISAVLPAQREEAETMVRLAGLALAAHYYNKRLRAAVHYRAGQFDATIRDFGESFKVYPTRAWDWLFLAMAQHQLGRRDEARQSLEKAEAWIDRANKAQSAGSRVFWIWIRWYEAVEVDYILREARALVR
jgi:tetratricopeptide (TPR) repeat protein